MRWTILTACLLACAAPAVAQDYNAAANYGDLRLEAGFTPDPALVTLLAGGSLDAADRFDACRGYITETPDVRLYWEGSGKSSMTLKISAISNADTTLVVNGPDGRWYCDDDGGDDSNPAVEFSPIAGRYEIWIGTYSSGDSKQAVLSISELCSF